MVGYVFLSRARPRVSSAEPSPVSTVSRPASLPRATARQLTPAAPADARNVPKGLTRRLRFARLNAGIDRTRALNRASVRLAARREYVPDRHRATAITLTSY